MEAPERGGRRLQVLEQQLNPQQLQPAAAAAAPVAAAAQLKQWPIGAPVNLILQRSRTSTQDLAQVQEASGIDHHGARTQLKLQAPVKVQQQQQQQSSVNPVPLLSRFGPPCEHVATLHDCWQAAVARFPAEQALGWRSRNSSGRLAQQYSWMTYAQVRGVTVMNGWGTAAGARCAVPQFRLLR